jgi:hypothetical protein
MTSSATLLTGTSQLSSTTAGLQRWISSGLCQSQSGAFVAWYDLATGRPSHDYPEISGYALTYLAGQSTLSTRELAAGHRGAEWLLARVNAGNLAARDGWDNRAIYLFDLGMIATGLLSFGRRVQDRRFIAAGLELVDWLDNEPDSARSVSPISARGNASTRQSWSTLGQAHLTKIVQAFLLATGFEHGGARRCPELLIETAKRLQYEDGRFATDCDQSSTMLHPHLYAAEGLWIWGSARRDNDCLERSRAAVAWAWSHQLPSGGFPARAPTATDDSSVEQSDVTAQAVRLALMLGIRSPAIDRAVRRLIESTREQRGAQAVLYQPDSTNGHLNTWATIFAAQALAMAVPHASAISWRQLV